MSKIEWTDSTVNVQIGCSRVSPGCEHCYAEKQANALARRFGKPGQVGHRYLPVVDGKGRWSREIVLDEGALARPPHGPSPYGHGIPKRKRDGTGWRPTRVFLGSMTDHFHEGVTEDMFDSVVDWMRLSQWVIWQMVTKRAERAPALLRFVAEQRMKMPTIHLLATVEDQQRADERIPHLLGAKRYVDLVGLSVEPMLGPVTLRDEWLAELGWVIVGGESGPGSRPCDIAWVRSIVTQCRDAGVPVFVKQLGANASERRCGALWPLVALGDVNHPKGGDWSEWPPDLRVREWPPAT